MAKLVASFLFCVTLLAIAPFAAGQARETMDTVLQNPQVLESVKTVGLAILSQANPATAEHDAAEVRKNVWAARPDAGLSAEEAEFVLKEFDASWANMAAVVRERNLQSIQFVGIDFVLLKRSMDWYYGAATPRGPVLICVSVQYNENRPMTFHNVRTWFDWDQIKAETEQFDVAAQSKVMTITLNRPTTQPAAASVP